jgi:hypothetical protein
MVKVCACADCAARTESSAVASASIMNLIVREMIVGQAIARPIGFLCWKPHFIRGSPADNLRHTISAGLWITNLRWRLLSIVPKDISTSGFVFGSNEPQPD